MRTKHEIDGARRADNGVTRLSFSSLEQNVQTRVLSRATAEFADFFFEISVGPVILPFYGVPEKFAFTVVETEPIEDELFRRFEALLRRRARPVPV